MPELPEVETTTKGLRKSIVGLIIKDVWTDLARRSLGVGGLYKQHKDTIKDQKFFAVFKKEIKNRKIVSVERRAKNILINLFGNKTILIHMKMTGHLLYGKYKNDPINRFIHFTITFNNKEKLYFSDMRKFGKITLLDTKTAHDTKHLKNIGPEPLDKSFTLDKFQERLNRKPKGKIKTVLMDQSIIAGIGNIYSDEILWQAGVHPERKVSTLLRQGFGGQGNKNSEMKLMFEAMKEILAKGIDFGGDSMSDYRNIHGLPGKFQLHHQAYRRTGEKCRRYRVSSKDRRKNPRHGGASCQGIIMRKIVGGRSAHFCSIHQK